MSEPVHVLLLLLLSVSGQHLLCEAHKPPLFRGGAWRGTGGSLGDLSGLAARRGILQCRGFC